ncbi:hypothetical protein [Gordonia sp. i37]|uniref:hypothetical protein n=1 Tax=Gordonia sp. i37 TaxID=1961707 RepID=UPI0009AD0BAB|nr:hypothetical protein [Gordonia sp. i37]OPX09683.1 hypothetical protein B1964_24710 [Gordonia sp. i37]
MAASKTRRNVRVLGATAAIVGAGALTAVMAAPASAGVTGVSITTPSGFALSSGSYGTSCSYTVSANINNSQASAPAVSFTVSKNGGAPVALGTSVPASGPTVTTTWKPSSKGAYTITATQDGVSQSTTANVTGTGIQLPSPVGGGNCLVLPF